MPSGSSGVLNECSKQMYAKGIKLPTVSGKYSTYLAPALFYAWQTNLGRQ